MTTNVHRIPAGIAGRDDAFDQLNALLSTKPHEFLRPTPELQQLAIRAAKAVLDPLAISVSDAQIERRTDNKRKRKRGSDREDEHVLHIKQVHTVGFGTKQIWEQAKRVLDAACAEVERTIDSLQIDKVQSRASVPQAGGVEHDDDNVIDESDGTGRDDIEIEDGFDEEDGNALDGDDVSDGEDIEDDSDVQTGSEGRTDGKQEILIQDPNGLNDGFFSIDEFNKQTQFLEQMDARGDDDNPSDEDEVDWDADPLTVELISPKSSKRQPRAGDDDDDGEEDGPVFGNANLEESDDDSDEANDVATDEDQDLDIGMNLSNANDIRYTDFFEPPAKKPSKTKRMRALPKTQPPAQPKGSQQEDGLRDDIERAMADVRRDLLDSDDEADFADDQDDSDTGIVSRADPSGKNLSTHEKQRAVIAAEIKRLEAANVAKRDWQLSGEARAVDRPVNSLLEEDLEFERAGKPVPVVTAETSEEIEQLIKRRILAREFDEVIRRSAVGLGSASDTRRGRIELDDAKPQASLGELYEQDHLKSTDPASYVDKRSAATKKQHEQIDVLWREVNEQLNLLSNLHFKPKRVDIEMKTVQDKPRIAMEDARPVGEIDSGEGGMLAPQEVYKPGGTTNEITLRNTGTSLSKEELTREEKLRRRRREKERAKKSQNNKAQVVLGKGDNKSKPGKSRKQEKNDIISDLKKGNVKIVGKDGDLQSLGKNKKGRSEPIGVTTGAGNFKL